MSIDLITSQKQSTTIQEHLLLPTDHSIYCSLFHKPDNVEYLNNFNMSMVGLLIGVNQCYIITIVILVTIQCVIVMKAC